MTQGASVDITEGHHVLKPGEYGKCPRDGIWYARPPVEAPLTANLALHGIVEHEDGTITASPSILVEAGALGTWHGFLERGIWREC